MTNHNKVRRPWQVFFILMIIGCVIFVALFEGYMFKLRLLTDATIVAISWIVARGVWLGKKQAILFLMAGSTTFLLGFALTMIIDKVFESKLILAIVVSLAMLYFSYSSSRHPFYKL